ncbi:MAG: hypothetical protein ABW092_09480, partial [Candidatus Thiodiazotropha sp.]
DAAEKLLKDGFTSIEAVKLIDVDDLAKSKIPRGQQKLILASVQALNRKDSAQISAQDEPEIISERRTAGAHQTSAPLTNQSEATSGQQDGGAHPIHSATSTTEDPYAQMLQLLQNGQTTARSEIANQSRQTVLNGLGVSAPNLATNSHSWKDPQIYLSAAASGKSAPTHYDITDFVATNSEEEIFVGGNGTQQVVLKSGPKKPKLENVTLAQWSVANLAILYKLLGDNKLHAGNILDYLSYTTKFCQLVQKFSLVSVLMYDREYRKLQSSHDFRWGTDVPHLHTVHLQPKALQGTPAPNSARANHISAKYQSHNTPMTLDGKVICKLFNSNSGCHYRECRYVHQCSQVGCHQAHSAASHHQQKN